MDQITQKYCLCEIDTAQANRITGGFYWIAVAGAIIYLYNNWDDFCAGVNDGLNANN